MSLRMRLSVVLGLSFLFLWVIAAAWMLCDLRQQMNHSLDERLAASARMVAGLTSKEPKLFERGNSDAVSTEKLGVPKGLACQIISMRGEVLAGSHASLSKSLAETGSGFHDQTINGLPWRTFTIQVGEVMVSTGERVDERGVLNQSILLAAAVPVTVALLGSLFLFWVVIGDGLRPLRLIRDELSARQPDSLAPLSLQRLPVELKPLVQSQNQLFTRISDFIEREKRFTGDAAHELRTPLTAIKTHLQVASITQGSDFRNAMQWAREGVERMQRTLEQLMLLARVEGSEAIEDEAPLSITDLVRQAVEDSTAMADKHLLIEIDDSLRDLRLPSSYCLLSPAIRNLLENGLRHAPRDTSVSLAIRPESGGIVFEVIDGGSGVDPGLIPHLTERFWSHGTKGSSGLGLAIVDAIAQRLRGKLDFANTSYGFRASIYVPLDVCVEA